MQAIVYRDYGGPDCLELTDCPALEPARDEILIRVSAAGVNPVDARLRQGEMKGLLPGGFPRIPGYDVAGLVESADADGHFAKGDRVMAFLDHLYGGGYAEFAACGVDSVVKIPESMPFAEAAVLPLAGATALQSLKDHGQLKSEERILINGASKGVGAFAVQIAVAEGATVTAVTSGPHEGFVRSLGATDFINYQQDDFTKFDRYWDVVFDAAGKSSFSEVKPVLAKGGRYVSTEPSLRGLVVSLITWPLEQRGRVMLARSRKDDLLQLLHLYESGQLRVTIAESFPFGEAAEAHRRIENDSFCGKLVIVAPQTNQ
ncbi:MAG: NAD(P)-dependent alcohol dehydrogenase [Planctomycetaceae bacterium]|nr:NAD(P)-dependent alcohol dehydrogenase [Planctomycetaceae bacterium]